jgi:hypothetical protein
MTRQLKSITKIRLLLCIRELKKLVAGICIPIVMVGIALGMSAAIQSGIPSTPPTPLISSIPMKNSSALPDNGKVGIIGSSALLKSTLEHLGKPNVEVVPFLSVKAYQETLTRFYRNDSLPFVHALFVVPEGVSSDIKYNLYMDSQQPNSLVPLLLGIAEQMKQQTVVPPTNISFTSFMTLYQNNGFYLDVSTNIVPPFLAYGFSFLIPFFCESRVLEFEKGYFDYLSTMGLSPFNFYFSSFIIDLGIYLINVTSGLAVLTIARFSPFLETDFIIWLLPLVGFGPSAIVLSYILGFLFESAETCSMVLSFAIAIIVFVPYFVISMILKGEITMLSRYILSFLLPTFGIYETFSVLYVHVGN